MSVELWFRLPITEPEPMIINVPVLPERGETFSFVIDGQGYLCEIDEYTWMIGENLKGDDNVFTGIEVTVRNFRKSPEQKEYNHDI